jgi:DNA-binding MarR family transcriptional regulator
VPPAASSGDDLTDRDYQRLLDLRDGLRRFLHWSELQAQAAGITPAQHQLLLAVRGHRDGPPTLGDVSAHLLLRHHSAVGLVDRAEAAGLVRRARDDDDHRVVRVELTDRGAAVLAALTAAHKEELERIGLGYGDLGEHLPDG